MPGDSKSAETGLELVASLLTDLQRQVLKGGSDIAEIKGVQHAQDTKLDAIHGEVRYTNGKVTKLREDVDELVVWRDGFQDESEQAAAYAAGVEKRKADERKVAHDIWRVVKPYALVALGAVAAWGGQELGGFLLGVWR